MKIEIHNYLSGSQRLEQEPGSWDSIVILDSGLGESQFVKSCSRKSLQLRFDDVSRPTDGKVEPSKAAISSAIQFGLASDRLIVCCRAGQSRSAATALSIVFEKMGKKAAFDLLDPRRHSPNYRVLELAEFSLTQIGLLDLYDEWRNGFGDIRLTDYLDEIESEYDELKAIGARDLISKQVNGST